MSTSDRIAEEHPGVLGSLLAEAELHRAVSAVESAGIECAVIKGIPLARRLYGHVDARGVPVDTDLLVRHADVPAAVDALVAAGYASPYLPRPLRQLTGVWKVTFRRQIEAGVTAMIELHWAPFSPRTFPLHESLVWAHIERFELPTGPVSIPERSLTIVLLACHLAQSGLVAPQIVHDFAAAWNAWSGEIDVAESVALASEACALPCLAYAMEVADHRMLLTVPAMRVRSAQAELAARLMPDGRARGTNAQGSPNSGPDYPGQLAALLLCHPSRLPVELARFLVPSRAGIAVATNGPFPGVVAYGVGLLRRWGRIGKGLTELSPSQR